jgi:hypothetical protein
MKKEKETTMEALVFALIAVRNGFTQEETFVPEPAEFRPFDLRALKRSYQEEENSSGRPSNRSKSFVTQVAS